MHSNMVGKNIQNLIPYAPGKPVEEVERELGIRNSIKLASNENPLGPSPLAMEAVAAHLGKAHLYPDGGAFYLRNKIASTLGVTPDRVMAGNGSNDVIEILAHTLLMPGDHGLMSYGAFAIYKIICQGMDREFTEVPMVENQWKTDVDALLGAIHSRTKMIFLPNPNNPTGTYLNKDEMDRLIRGVPKETIVVLDEAYTEYVTAGDYADGMTYIDDHPNVVVCRTFSKAYGLAGLRCGYAVGSPQLINFCNRIRQPFNVSALAQVAAVAALDDREFISKSHNLNKNELKAMHESLTSMGLEVIPSQANFLMVRMGEPCQSVFDWLLRHGIIVRPLNKSYGMDDCIRITIGTSAENKALIEAMGKYLDERAKGA